MASNCSRKQSFSQQTANPNSKVEETNVDTNALKELHDVLAQRVNFYKQRNNRMEVALKKVLSLHEINTQSRAQLTKLATFQEEFEIEQCTVEAIGLSHADRLQKQTNYKIKIQNCIKIYTLLVEKVTHEIKILKGEFERSQKKISSLENISPSELKGLQTKIERYEKELIKFEKKYPWLVDKQYNLQYIVKETEILNNLRREKEKLVQELDVYQNLQPNLNEASKQLASIKLEYNSIT